MPTFRLSAQGLTVPLSAVQTVEAFCATSTQLPDSLGIGCLLPETAPFLFSGSGNSKVGRLYQEPGARATNVWDLEGTHTILFKGRGVHPFPADWHHQPEKEKRTVNPPFPIYRGQGTWCHGAGTLAHSRSPEKRWVDVCVGTR